MKVVNKDFYHIHRTGLISDQWYVGNKIVFSKDYYNVYFDFYVNFNIQKTNSEISQDVKITEYAIFIRELVYEEVRTLLFSDLPSRRHCIWLCDEKSLQFWSNTFANEGTIYKVRATGNLHECYAGALDDDNINYNILFQKATAYWRGECIGSPLEKEYILEGEVEIIQKM